MFSDEINDNENRTLPEEREEQTEPGVELAKDPDQAENGKTDDGQPENEQTEGEQAVKEQSEDEQAVKEQPEGEQAVKEQSEDEQPEGEQAEGDQPENEQPEYGQPEESERVTFERTFGPGSEQATADEEEKDRSPRIKKKGKAGKVILCSFLIVLLVALTVVCSVAATTFWISKTSDKDSRVTSRDAEIKVNHADIEQTAVSAAANAANSSVVVIDIFKDQQSYAAGNRTSSGSGVIWSASGYIVTCNHVVDSGDYIVVTLAGGRRYQAQIIGRDVQTDLAVLKIEDEKDLPAAMLRGTDLVLGETIIAIGNPLGIFSNSVTDGIISCLERQIKVAGQSMTLLQISAAVNSGNSGGGLFDVNGSLCGIVNAKTTEDRAEGIGFAIPIGTVRRIVTEIIEKGYVSGRPALGFESVYITFSNYSEYPDLSKYCIVRTWLGNSLLTGEYVTGTDGVAGYKGEESLQFGDRVIQVGNTVLTDSSDMISAISSLSPGDTVKIVVERNNKRVNIELILSEYKN